MTAGSAFLGSCTDVDDTLGLDIVPDDQRMVVETRTIGGVKSYIAYSDSIPTNSIRRMTLGSMTTDFGRTTASSVCQFMPLESYRHRGDPYFGEGAVLDSVYLALYIGNITGKTRVPQTFQIFPLEETMKFDSTYYATDDISGNVKSDPVFEFKLEKEIAGTAYKKLWSAEDTDSPLFDIGKTYLEKIVNLPEAVWADEDEGEGLFHREVPGFYITPYVAPGEPEGDAIYEILFADSFYQVDLTYLLFFTHTGEGESTDSLETIFYMDDKEVDTPELSNLSITLVEHDYDTPGSVVDKSSFLVLNEEGKISVEDGTPQEEVMYIQTLLGPAGYIVFDDDFKQNLREIMSFDETVYSSVFINRAKLVAPMVQAVDDDDYAGYVNRVPWRLGLYFDYKGELPVSIPDYPYFSELLSGYESSFGGYLNQSKGRFEMDVSTYIRQLILHPDDTRDQLWIAPAFSTNNFSRLGEVMIANTPNTPGRQIELEITYTLIK